MRSIAMIGSLVALIASAPLAAQNNNKFRTGQIDTARISLPRTEQERQNAKSDRIPPGQRPPAGMCRIWIDGVPAGRQPAPTDCQTAVATKPANARVIWGDQTAFPGKGKGKFDKTDRHDDGDKKLKKDDRDDDDRKGKKGKGRGHGKDD